MTLVAGCGPSEGDTNEEETEETGDAATIDEDCTKVMACGGWGWGDQAECEALFIGDEAMQTVCSDEPGYFTCVAGILDEECDPFANLEADCWTQSCR